MTSEVARERVLKRLGYEGRKVPPDGEKEVEKVGRWRRKKKEQQWRVSWLSTEKETRRGRRAKLAGG